ncbi:uncharacterized protein LOC118434503 [Folsomia candida]|uniref:uncharacterized protein LOC118434503 n=1 Tax=Folsomia candida TaxID=158441 RepID=UPI0016051E96|nr:uncharacterized protein LOC118434503 [Folsomia candida]
MVCATINQTLSSNEAEFNDSLISPSADDLILNRYMDVVVVTVLGLSFIFAETCAFLVVLKRKKIRQVISPSSFFNLHASLLFVVLSPTLRLMRQLHIIPCNPGEWSCGVCGVGIRTLVSIYPFCMVVIFSELTKSRESKSLPCCFLLFIPWVMAILVSLPVFWTYVYIQEQPGLQNGGTCARIILLGSPLAYYGYESISVFLRFVAPSSYMIYAMRRIGF